MESILTAPHSRTVVIFVHGMQEYSDRYRAFCQDLADHGYSNLRYDLIGHGHHLPADQRGYFGHKGWHNFNAQLHHYIGVVHDKFPGQRVVLFGHSMGTIIIRSYLQHYQDFDGLIFSGVPYYNPLWRVGKAISQLMIWRKGEKGTSHLLDQLTVGGYNHQIKHPATDFDWLCRNPRDVQAYIHDEACGFPFTNQGYNDLYEGMQDMGRLRHFRSPRPVPLLFLNGHDDPCAGSTRQVWGSIKTLQRAGFRDLTYCRYPHMRHEILFEKNADRVEADIIHWLNKKFG